MSDLKDGRVALAEKWMPDKLWDIHTPQNKYDLAVSLLDDAGKVLHDLFSNTGCIATQANRIHLHGAVETA